MANQFTQVPMAALPKNRFNLSHDLKTSFDMGQLVPTAVMECLPGDYFKISVENMLRFIPLATPVMHDVTVTTHYFFVPNRILDPNWEDFITSKQDILPPTLGFSDLESAVEIGSLFDYYGIPPDLATNQRLNAHSFAAYFKIYDEYYRDQNLQPDELFQPLQSGNNNTWLRDLCLNPPLRRAWQHDYFTACLPFAQKGDAVQVPLTIQEGIPVELVGDFPDMPQIILDENGDPSLGVLAGGASPSFQDGSLITQSGPEQAWLDPNGSLIVDVQSDAVDINTLRRAFRLQEWLEKNARGGTRYTEFVMSHFGVMSSDARFQRPEYIGGSKQSMVISEVLSTAQTQNGDSLTPVGDLAGHGISVGGGNTFDFFCEEHGWIIGIVSVRPTTAYQQGVHRKFSRFDPLDYYFETFANIGEQEVLNQEIYAVAGAEDPFGTFGFIPRYSEYRFENSRVSGLMREEYSAWHLGRIFDSQPALNAEFIECNPSKRIFAFTEAEQTIIAHIFNNITAVRRMPKFGIPTI